MIEIHDFNDKESLLGLTKESTKNPKNTAKDLAAQKGFKKCNKESVTCPSISLVYM